MSEHTPLIIGHRGFAGRFPDNSVAGVRAALAAGADGVEVDVRPTADGVWVCHHDRRRGGVPIEQWQAGALGAAGVPELADVLAAVDPGRWLFVEVKPLGRVLRAQHLEALAALVAPRTGRVRVISSSLPILGEMEQLLPRVPLSWVFGALPEWLPLGVELSPRHTLVEPLLASGRALHPWTVNAASRMRELVALGVASLTTDRPDRAVEVLRG